METTGETKKKYRKIKKREPTMRWKIRLTPGK